MKKTIAVLVAFLAIFICGCSQTKEADNNSQNKVNKTKRVVFSQTEEMNPWLAEELNSFEAAAAAKKMELIYHEPKENTSEWQVKDLLSLLNDNIDYMVISPRRVDQLFPVLEKAKQKKIPVILVEGPTSGTTGEDSSATVISTDYVKEGEICAQLLEKRFGDKPCKIVEIQGSVGSIVARDRDVGFRQEIKKHPNMQICASEVGDFNRITAEKAMENIIINSHNSFNAVFAHSDEDGLGALQALKGAGMDPGKNISIVSVNGVQDVLKAILAGEYLATVENNPKLGYVVFEVIDQMERGTVPPSQIVMPYRIIDYSNAMECMETS